MLLTALRMTWVTLALTGLVYPLAVTAAAQILFPFRANGSLATDPAGAVIGSELIGQSFGRPGYFQPRPSAAGANGYDGAASSGSNLGPTSKKLQDATAAVRAKLRRENPGAPGDPPADLLTASASGLDPHLSPAAARWQVERVAQARGVSADRVQLLVETSIEGRDLGFLGEPRVNVLMLNLALDRQLGSPPKQTPPTAR